ncbi:hypothetical protein [Teredinibacter purpureus]|uniref:hypothetical protein n=1 Tax=Teredinibacter purpureus TaxID=2731756 RepID=UPI0013C4A00D|nr:hypothetical protein [Teredinibacter purpureus]
MKRFYPDFESIQAFTLSLDYHQNELTCVHCSKSDQFVSHGIIYKQRSSVLADKVGKRLFCSNRYGRSGCGRTFQLYVASEVPAFRYGAAHLFIFITALVAKVGISEAYHQATGQLETRNAWRWLNRLMFKLSHYRSVLKYRKDDLLNSFRSSSHYCQHLLPTLTRLFTSTKNGCIHYQTDQQQSFL